MSIDSPNITKFDQAPQLLLSFIEDFEETFTGNLYLSHRVQFLRAEGAPKLSPELDMDKDENA